MCPLCYEVMLEPVVTQCGHTFDKLCLQTVLKRRPSCPVCRTELMENVKLSTCVALRNLIQRTHPRLVDQRQQSLRREQRVLHLVRSGDVRGLRAAIAEGANVNTVDFSNGASALHACDRPTMMKLLLDAKANCQLRDEEGFCPLHRAVVSGKRELVALLAQVGGDTLNWHADLDDPDEEDAFGQHSPLQLVLAEDRVDILKVLLDAGADPDLTNDEGLDGFLTECVTNKAVRCVLEMLKRYPEELQEDWIEENKLMSAACYLGHIPLVKYLLAMEHLDGNGYHLDAHGDGEFINEVNIHSSETDFDEYRPSEFFWWRPITAAIAAGDGGQSLPVVKLLLAHNAVVDTVDEKGFTCIHHLAMCRNVVQGHGQKLLELLLQEGALVDHANDAGITPLLVACWSKHIPADAQQFPFHESLLKEGANVNACTTDGKRTALLGAVASGAEALVALLLQHGANLVTPEKQEGHRYSSMRLRINPVPYAVLRSTSGVRRHLLGAVVQQLQRNPGSSTYDNLDDKVYQMLASVARAFQCASSPSDARSTMHDFGLVASECNTALLSADEGLWDDGILCDLISDLSKCEGGALGVLVKCSQFEWQDVKPLHLVVQSGSVSALIKLMDSAALPVLKDCMGELSQNREYCDREKKGFIRYTPLLLAIAQANIEGVSLLLKYGASVNMHVGKIHFGMKTVEKSRSDYSDEESYWSHEKERDDWRDMLPLHVACCLAPEQAAIMVPLLLQHGAGKNIDSLAAVPRLRRNFPMGDYFKGLRWANGITLVGVIEVTALHLAVMGRNPNLANLLLKAGSTRLGSPSNDVGSATYKVASGLDEVSSVNTLDEAAWSGQASVLHALLALGDGALCNLSMLKKPPPSKHKGITSRLFSFSDRDSDSEIGVIRKQLKKSCDAVDLDAIREDLHEYKAKHLCHLEKLEEKLREEDEKMEQKREQQKREQQLKEQRTLPLRRSSRKRELSCEDGVCGKATCVHGAGDVDKEKLLCDRWERDRAQGDIYAAQNKYRQLAERAEGLLSGQTVRKNVELLKHRALLLAVQGGHVAAMQTLVAAGAPVKAPFTQWSIQLPGDSARGEDGSNSLMRAFSSLGLHGYAASRQMDALSVAVEAGQAAMVCALLSHGVLVEGHASTEPELRDLSQQIKPLLLAAMGGFDVIVLDLLKHGADPDVRDDISGLSALHIASMLGHNRIVQHLLAFSAQPDHEDKVRGWSPLLFAAAAHWVLSPQCCNCKWGLCHSALKLCNDTGVSSTSVMELLVNASWRKAGEDEEKKKECQSALTMALGLSAVACRPTLVQRLLDLGADISVFRLSVGGSDSRPLFQAIQHMSKTGVPVRKELTPPSNPKDPKHQQVVASIVRTQAKQVVSLLQGFGVS